MPSILLVDDNPDVRALFAETLADGGYAVIEAGSADEASPLLPEADILISDCIMPGGDDRQGRHLAEESRRLGIPALLLTGSEARAQTVEAMGFPVLRKPVRGAALLRRVAELLAIASGRR